MKADDELRRDVEQELEWEPSVDERRIGVSVIEGIVTLTGEVGSYAHEAEKAAWAAPGVRKVHNYITVEPVASAA